jgi:RHS repeat-associated protein
VLHEVGTSTPLDGATYTYDNAGNRLTREDERTSATTNYGYDNIYQLTSATGGSNESYTYDLVGNRLTSASVPNYTVNSSNELTSTNNATYTYDDNGNTLTKADSTGTTSYNWDFENRLTSVALPGSGGTVTFKYDPFGRRIQKASSLSTTNYLYDEADTLEEVDASGVVVARYTMGPGGDQVLAESTASGASYYHPDGLGSVLSLSNSSGALTDTYSYDSFGNQVNQTGVIHNSLRYITRNLDSETGLLYLRARYFDPRLGRFLSEDPIKLLGGANFFRYSGNNPVNWSDPKGKCAGPDCKIYVSCNVTPNTDLLVFTASHCTVTIFNGSTYTGYDGGYSGNPYWGTLVVGAGTQPAPPSHPFFTAPLPCNKINCAKEEADVINAGNVPYSAILFNSNTAAWAMSQNCGVSPQFPSDAWGSGTIPKLLDLIAPLGPVR